MNQVLAICCFRISIIELCKFSSAGVASHALLKGSGVKNMLSRNNLVEAKASSFVAGAD